LSTGAVVLATRCVLFDHDRVVMTEEDQALQAEPAAKRKVQELFGELFEDE
jgi:hypothetical protein